MSFSELKKLEVERVRLQAELTALQESMPTKAAMEAMAAFIARTPEPLVPVVVGASAGTTSAGTSSSGSEGGAGAVPTAGGAAAPPTPDQNPWTVAPPASFSLRCPGLLPMPCLPESRCSIV